MTYKIGDIVHKDSNYPAVAEYCNVNGLVLVELSADKNGERYQIQSPPAPSKTDRIFELKSKLADTDYKALKFAEGELTAEQYAPIREERKAWRAEINQLESEIEV